MLDKFRQFIKAHHGWIYLISVVIAYTFIVYMSYRPESY
ncbi:hypothetical protein P9VFCI_033 [Rhizobium phage P9VFCI]|uniref:Uncharacterized protein n=2 Tax=Innesvirus TaxID=3044739 RepID=A0A7G7WXT8_9CAUD|nr:hypothetical protein PP937_gp033 [Rhizobium phage P9VFCI]YP_010662182.1 hypothetical protein PP938_gp032 [Rhizobium phage AF3]QNH71619.1 hypothetical protein AF3_032 [Rhizobium phage AF3]QNH72032.1 hypothetical protein P9VFCI_033 [Rhizobium phage P9VFCI]